MTARDPSKPPGKCNRADRGGKTEKWPVSVIREALIEARGSVTDAARLITAQAIAKSDRDNMRSRNRAAKHNPNTPLKGESPEATKIRHDACRITPRRVREYLDRYPELKEAREEAKSHFLIECEDVLHAAVRERQTKRVQDPSGGEKVIIVNQPTPLAVRTSMFMLDRLHPDYKRSIRVSQDNGPRDPLDVGSLPEEEQRRLAGDDAEEP